MSQGQSRRIEIDPVTRIEGHAKITIQLGDDGRVRDARFHVGEFRGFEKFCEGRPFWEMPGLTSRICGICPVSHLLASAKAGDGLLAVEIPSAAVKLRRMLNLAQIVQSHALSFFHMSAPDLLLGMDSHPSQRNLFGLIAAEPELARRGIRLRQFGQTVIEILGGRKVHTSWAVPGGVNEPLAAEGRDQIRGGVSEALAATETTLVRFKEILNRYSQEAATFGNFPALSMGLVGTDGTWEHYDGHLRVVDSCGNVLVEGDPAEVYREKLAEAVESESYLKSPYYRPLGYPDGLYRVGPLARLNVCERMGTPRADEELDVYRSQNGRIVHSAFFYHQARLIEMIAALERLALAVDDPEILSTRVRAQAGVNRLESIGVSEAPRGTLFHDYQVERDGKLLRVNLIIATGQNNLAMNRTVAQIAEHFIRGPSVDQGILNRLEAGIRAYDPCLSCSTHAVGSMPLVVEIVDSEGQPIRVLRRG